MTDEVQMTVLKINHHSPQHCAERWPYAAYGSNLMHQQIIERCPAADIIGVGRILDYKLVFARVATIVPDQGSTVPVGLYKLNAADIASLDRREGLGRAYDRYLITPITSDGRAMRCFTYIKRDCMLEPPTDAYYQRLHQGYRDWMIDDRRLRHARAAAQRAWENPKHRADVEKHHRQSKAVWGIVNANGPGPAYWGRVKEQPKSATMRAIQRAATPSRDERLKSDDDTFDRIEREAKRGVPRFATASHQNVEWGKRNDTLYWRVRGTRSWYRDVSGHEDIQSGLVRGEFEETLPGAQAFKVVDNKRGKHA